MGFGPGQHVEGEREQAVADEDCGRFIERAVHGRPPAPQVVVVHRRKIVVHQRVAMHAFECGADHQRAFARRPEQTRGFDHQKGADAFSPAEARVAHRLDEPPRPHDLVLAGRLGEQAIEQPLGIRGRRAQALRKGSFDLRGHGHDLDFVGVPD